MNNQLSSDGKLFFPGEKLLNDVAKVANVATLDFDTAIDVNTEALNNAKLVIDNSLIESSENPGALGSAEFMAAVTISISQDHCLSNVMRQNINTFVPAPSRVWSA